MSEWQPAETAPKNGAWFLACLDLSTHYRTTIIRYVSGDTEEASEKRQFGPFIWAEQDEPDYARWARDTVKAWMLLPTPPSWISEEPAQIGRTE